jgi:phenylalanyl-tRNA synthetase beta chain
MRISLNWLRELVATSLTPEVLGETLTLAGFEVEEIEDRATWAEGVVIGRVIDRQPHPNADKLSVCQVDIGTGTPQQIVCGAANVRADIFVPVATVGAFLPRAGDGGLKIKPAQLRGVESNGMICSLSELGLPKDNDGIYIFEPAVHGNLQPGADARPYLGLEDVVLDLSSTANRADALSLVGIAREVAALTGATLQLPTVAAAASITPGLPASVGDLTIAVTDFAACPTYIGTVISGVTIAPSPLWLQQRLQSSGVRPINNVVDVTNYIMLEWGQPLHAFDRDRLQTLTGGAINIGVRFAQAGETLTTLDGHTRTATEQTLFITGSAKSGPNQPIALAGVMGGEATEVHGGSQNLLLEAALFDTAAVRKSARSQGLRSEASLRYERGVNLAELERATGRAIELITQLAGGTVTQQAMQDQRPATLTRQIDLRLARVQEILGQVTDNEDVRELTGQEVMQTLARLNCQLAPNNPADVWKVTVPPYRYRDLEREIDLIEEVARVYGYNRFDDTLPPVQTDLGYLSIEQTILRSVRESFRAIGLTEVMHYSLVKPGKERQIVLSNPLFAEYSALRTDLLDGMIDACQFNIEQGNGPLNGFEIGHVFTAEGDGYVETECLTGIFGGDVTQGKWQRGGKDQPLTWFEAKGLLTSVFDRLGLNVDYQSDRKDDRLHPGRTASLWIGGDRLGTFGQLHPQLRQTRDLPDEIYVFELALPVLMQHLGGIGVGTAIFKTYSSFPASDRDIAFYANSSIAVADLTRSISQSAGPLLESVQLFDEYKGDRVPRGQRSLAFRLIYRKADGTLTDEAIEPAMQKVRDTLVEKFQVELRS